MSLATRCNACGTVFRVVEDQLKVSDGWVRCGRCNAVFDALEGMVEAEHQPADATAGSPRQPEHAGTDAAALADDEPVDIHHLLSREDSSSGVDSRQEPELGLPDSPEPKPGVPAAEHDDAGAAITPEIDIDPAQRVLDDHSPPDAEPAQALSQLDVSTAPGIADSTPVISPGLPPSFMRQPERDKRWQNPAMRAALIGSSLILSLMLVSQVVYHQRDAIAARSTLLGEWLQSACLRWNCSIEAPRNIRAVTIENSALTQLVGQPQAARLSLTMRNRSAEKLTMPAVELSLTDFEGKLIARRALMPSDFQVDPPVLAANSERPLQIVVSTTDRRIAGYTVELFYP